LRILRGRASGLGTENNSEIERCTGTACGGLERVGAFLSAGRLGDDVCVESLGRSNLAI